MEPKIRRKFKSLPVTLATTTAAATTIRWDDFAAGCVLIGAGATAATSLQVWCSNTQDGTFGRLYTSGGAAADITLAPSATEARVYALPDAACGAGSFKLVANNAAATSVSCVVTLKT